MTREHERLVVAKRVCWESDTADIVADAWTRGGLALGAPVQRAAAFPVTVDVEGRAYSLFIVIAYGFFDDEKQNA